MNKYEQAQAEIANAHSTVTNAIRTAPASELERQTGEEILIPVVNVIAHFVSAIIDIAETLRADVKNRENRD